MVGRWTLALVVASTAGLAAADAADALTRKQATQIALKALAPQKSKRVSVVVFGLTKPVPARTFVYEARPKKIIGTKAPNNTPVGARTGAPAWVFWEDLSYGAMFAHPSVMLLVDDRTGRIVKRQSMFYELMIGRERAPWLRTQAAYEQNTYVVYPSVPRRSAPVRAVAAAYPLGGKPPPRPQTLARECLVTIGEPEEWGKSLKAMENFGKNVGLRMPAKRPEDFAELRSAVEALIEKGCGDVLVYVVGHGIIPRGRDFPKGEKRVLFNGKTDADIQPATGEKAGPAAVKIRASAKLTDIATENPKYADESGYITPDNLITLAKENRLTADFKFKIDTCFAGRFERVFDEADNVRVLELSSRFNELSYAVGDKAIVKDTPIVDPDTKKPTGQELDVPAISNPEKASSFTNGNLHGLYEWFRTAPANEPFVDGIAKSFELGKGQDFARAGGWTRPILRTRGPTSRPVDFLQLDDGRISFDPLNDQEVFADGAFRATGQRSVLRQRSDSPIDLLVFSVPGNRQITDSICPPELPVGQRNGSSLSCFGGSLPLGKAFRLKVHTVPAPSPSMGASIIARQDGKLKGPFTFSGP
jgi:hypothetical protein